jgi:lysophospholipase L1-like esterase
MKRRTALHALLALTLALNAAGQEAVRVACVGDSITFGAGVEDRAKNNYPAALGRLLGPGYEVRNFGVNGATLLKKGDKPHWRLKAFQQATDFAPNVVVIKLGTNDTKPQNWKHGADFAADLAAMADHFAALSSKPAVWLCLPVPVYQTRWGINEKTLTGEVIPTIRTVAERKKLKTIDLYSALSGKPALFPDKIHPNARGATLIAQAVAAALTRREWTSLFNGKDLTGWAVKAKADDKAKGFWKVDSGTILADSMGAKGHDYVWLGTTKKYANFVLRLRVQAYKDSPGNSGVQIRSRYDDGAFWLDGPQVDIHPSGPWRTGMVWDETRESKRWLWPEVPKGKWVNPSMANKKLRFEHGEEAWNELEITAAGTRLQAALNDVIVMDWDGKGVLDDETHQKHNVGMKGIIAFQIHRGDQLRIRFKDIQVLELP